MKITIPHLKYSVEIKDIKKGDKTYTDKLNVRAYAERDDSNKTTIYIKLPIKRDELSTLCHELIHAMQNMCQDRNIRFENEEEHIGYIFQYLINEILGYEYK
jgi:hypothetical protein